MIVRTFAIYCDTCRNQPDWTRTHSAIAKRAAKADGWTITHNYHKCPACNGTDPHYWRSVPRYAPTADTTHG